MFRLFISIILVCAAFAGFAKEAELQMVSEYLPEQEVTDMCEWKGTIWASTETGLYRLEEDGAVQVAVPVKSNDKITSLYSGSPYTLICGTFQGDLLFITQDNSNYCQAVWSMKDYIQNTSFYVNCVGQNESGIWLGTLEKGMLLYNPETDSLKQFSFDYNDDTVGLNVYDFEIMKNGVTWTIAQDGLYFIMNIFGEEDELQYLKSNKLRHNPDYLYRKGEDIYVAYKDKGENNLAQAKLGKNAFDIRLKKKTRLPDGKIEGVEIISPNDMWVLTDRITHCVGERMIDYYIYPSNKKPFTTKGMLINDGYMYVSTKENGIFKYALEEKKPEENEIETRFDINEIAFNKSLELDLVFFAPGDSSLTPASHLQLDELVGYLEMNDSVKVVLTGHTAKDGNHEFLKQLSQARAQSVKDYLTEKGIAEKRIETIGKGAEELKITGNPKSPKNRRVEIILEN
jgi:outer membrane protein OmpA-like peptidoglycan-associated protein